MWALLLLPTAVVVAQQQCFNDDVCTQAVGIPQECWNIGRDYNSVQPSALYLSDAVTPDNNAVLNSIISSQAWLQRVANSVPGANSSVQLPNGGDSTQMRINLNYWCCLGPDDAARIAGIMQSFAFQAIVVRIASVSCKTVWQPTGDPAQPMVVITAMPDAVGNAALLNLVRQIELLVTQLASPSVPLVNPRPATLPFNIEIGYVQANVFPYQNAMPLLVPSNSLTGIFGYLTIQGIRFNGATYWSTDATFAQTQECPDCNSSSGTMIAAVMIFIVVAGGVGLWYYCKHRGNPLKDVTKSIKPTGPDSSDA